MPAREVGATDVADLAGAHELVERGEGFLDRRAVVLNVKLKQIYVIRAQPREGLINSVDQVADATSRKHSGRHHFQELLMTRSLWPLMASPRICSAMPLE